MSTNYVCPYFWCDGGRVRWTTRPGTPPAWICDVCATAWSLKTDPRDELDAACLERDHLVESLRQPLDVAPLDRYLVHVEIRSALVACVRLSRALVRVGVDAAWEVIAQIPLGHEVALSRWQDRITAEGAFRRYRRALRNGGPDAFLRAVMADDGGHKET